MDWVDKPKTCKGFYYRASSASVQDEPNRALWLATRAGKMEPSCPLGTTGCIPHEKFLRKSYNFIDQVCSAGYWPRSFLRVYGPRPLCRSINRQKKELGQYPAILTEQTWSTTHMYIKKTRCWTTSTQSSLLQELVPSLLTKIPFDHMILEGRQSLSANLMWASATQK